MYYVAQKTENEMHSYFFIMLDQSELIAFWSLLEF